VQRVLLWLPCGTMLLVSLISYIDRNALAALLPMAGFFTWLAINRERAVQRPRGAFTGSP
jgi:hypothetical protein